MLPENFRKRKGAIFRENEITSSAISCTVFMMPTASFADIIEGESIVTLGENLSEQQNKIC